MYKNLPTGIGVFGYRQEGELTRAVFCFDENSFSFREALSCVTDMLQQVFSAGRIKGEVEEITMYQTLEKYMEGKRDRKEAVRYLQELIKNSDYAHYARHAGEFMKQFPGNEFTQTDVLMAHEQFEAWCLGKNVLGASDTNPARDFMMDRDEAPESACDRL